MSGEPDFDDPWLEVQLQRLAGDEPGGVATAGARARVAQRARRLRVVRRIQQLSVAGLAAVAAVATTVAVLPDGGGRVEMTAEQGDETGAEAPDRPATTAPILVPAPPTWNPPATAPGAPTTTTAPATTPGPTAALEVPGASQPADVAADDGSGDGDPTGGAPPATTPPTTAATSTPPPPTSAPTTQAGTRTYAMKGGTVVIRWTATTLTLVSSTPTAGFKEAREVQPTEIEIEFSSAKTSSHVHVHLSGGQLVEENEEG